jgi:hypothetical protein
LVKSDPRKEKEKWKKWKRNKAFVRLREGISNLPGKFGKCPLPLPWVLRGS